MAKNLVIVESPAKTRTLKKFLGRQYAVEASLGHIRDLVKKDMGLGENYEPKYAVLADKKEVVKKLRAAAKTADMIYLAPDPDREGEAIAWHIAEVLDKDPAAVKRVTFNEITKNAVLKALSEPREIDVAKVDAQQARRVLDRMMGFRISPLLWDKVKQGLSAGRVQSVALKMVCERQDEIDAFQAVEYWLVGADLDAGKPPQFHARLHRIGKEKAEVGNGEAAARIVGDLEKGKFTVASVERKESLQRPSPPFITSRLQQEAARRHGFSVKRTMGLAQGLYEGREIGDRGQIGLITYMRTDSTRVSEEALVGVREMIEATYGAGALPEKANRYKTKKDAQDAHEAIRPTSFDLPPDAVADYLKPDELKLYKLIWDRFVASQMLPAVFDVTQADIAAGPQGQYTLRAQGKVLKRAGFLAVYREAPEEAEGGKGADGEEAREGAEGMLPPLSEGQVLKLVRLASEQKFTQPPAQFSEATLVKALEENGIGRPSTYAAILATITDRSYVEKIESRFRPTPLGKIVNTMLQGSFNDVINEGYTASLEEELDKIEEGTIDWKQAVGEFDEKFTRDLALAGETMPNVKKEGVPTGEMCPEDGAPLVMRFGRYGAFIACTNYPECKYTRNVEEAAAEETPAAGGAEGAAEEIPPCELCGKPMALRRSRFGTFYGCTGYPECKNLRKTGPAPAAPKPTGVPCAECGKGEMVEKRSRRGKIFYSCSRYPDCKNALWNKPVAKPCPTCGAQFLMEKTTKRHGTQLVCNTEGCGYVEAVEPAA